MPVLPFKLPGSGAFDDNRLIGTRVTSVRVECSFPPLFSLPHPRTDQPHSTIV